MEHSNREVINCIQKITPALPLSLYRCRLPHRRRYRYTVATCYTAATYYTAVVHIMY